MKDNAVSEEALTVKKSISKPNWLKTDIPKGKNYFEIKQRLRSKSLVTVCEEAKCPNIGECWQQKTATFMVLGDTCTRACKFCHIKTGNPQGFLDKGEPLKVAQSCLEMNLKYAVITMVDRDDLDDGGAEHLCQVVKTIHKYSKTTKVEILSGDFTGQEKDILKVVNSGLIVFAHNIETVKRLSPRVRDARAQYQKSLDVLKLAKKLSKSKIYTKSAIMLGLGETRQELIEALTDLRRYEVDFITIGQYMRPTKKHLSVKKWIHPDEFKELSQIAKELGFLSVASGPLVRSSYKAYDYFMKKGSQL